jgi:hypothetical protein
MKGFVLEFTHESAQPNLTFEYCGKEPNYETSKILLSDHVLLLSHA